MMPGQNEKQSAKQGQESVLGLYAVASAVGPVEPLSGVLSNPPVLANPLSYGFSSGASLSSEGMSGTSEASVHGF